MNLDLHGFLDTASTNKKLVNIARDNVPVQRGKQKFSNAIEQVRERLNENKLARQAGDKHKSATDKSRQEGTEKEVTKVEQEAISKVEEGGKTLPSTEKNDETLPSHRINLSLGSEDALSSEAEIILDEVADISVEETRNQTDQSNSDQSNSDQSNSDQSNSDQAIHDGSEELYGAVGSDMLTDSDEGGREFESIQIVSNEQSLPDDGAMAYRDASKLEPAAKETQAVVASASTRAGDKVSDTGGDENIEAVSVEHTENPEAGQISPDQNMKVREITADTQVEEGEFLLKNKMGRIMSGVEIQTKRGRDASVRLNNEVGTELESGKEKLSLSESEVVEQQKFSEKMKVFLTGSEINATAKLREQAGEMAAQKLEVADKALEPNTLKFTQTEKKPLRQTLETPVGHRNWATGIADKTQLFINQKAGAARLNLVPHHLGPIDIKIDFHENKVSVEFVATHATTKEALESTLPRLREIFESGGLNLGNVNVKDQASKEQKEQGFSAETARANELEEEGEGEEERQVSISSSLNGRVDYFA